MSPEETEGLSAAQREALGCILDTLIPKSEDGRLPGAGEIGLAAAIEEAMAAQPALRPAVALGLAAFEELVAGMGLDGFAASPVAERARLLEELGTSQPAFVPSLVFPTYIAYYQHPRVVVALGMEARPPHPKGYEMEPTDTSLLDEMMKRKPLYRDC